MGTFWEIFAILAKKPKKWDSELFDLGENFGAGDRGRTGDVQLGKLAFYH